MKVIYPISDIHCHTHDHNIDYCRLVLDVVVAAAAAVVVVVQFDAVTPYLIPAVGLAAVGLAADDWH